MTSVSDRVGEWLVYDGDGTSGEWIANGGGAWSHTYEIAEQCRLYIARWGQGAFAFYPTL